MQGALQRLSLSLTARRLQPAEAVQQDRWQHLGVYSSEVDAARAYDRAMVERKGLEAATNFALADYLSQLSERLCMGPRGSLPVLGT